MQVSPKLVSINFQCPDCGEEAQITLEDLLEEVYPECDNCEEEMVMIDVEIDNNAVIS